MINARHLPVIGALAALCFAGSAQAAASTDAAASVSAGPAAQSNLGGPVVAGACLLSQPSIFTQSAVGKAAAIRIRQLTDQAQVEVDAERQAIDTESKALQGQKGKLSSDELDKREQQFAVRFQAYQAKVAQRTREIDATRGKVVSQIAEYAQPVVASVYKAHGCGLLFSRDAVLAGNFANDVTADVIKALDAKVSAITFERERLADNAPAAQ